MQASIRKASPRMRPRFQNTTYVRVCKMRAGELLQAACLAQRLGLVAALPRELGKLTAKVAIIAGKTINRAAKVELRR